MATSDRIAQPCVHHAIERQADIAPDAPAVIWGGGTLTFRQLDDRANVLAEMLSAEGVGPERAVGVILEPSPLLLVTLFAIWKVGGVYVPVDGSLPTSVIDGMLTAVEAVLVIHDHPPGPVSAGVPTMDLRGVDLSGPPGERASEDLHPANLAYCVFTSGSTGKPKPVAVTHASLLNHAWSLADELDLRPADRVLQSTAPAIDAALEEIVPAWLAGAAVVVPARRRFTSSELTDLIERLGVTVVSLASAYWHHWVDDLSSGLVHLPTCLRLVFVGGDRIFTDKLDEWQRTPGAEKVAWISDYGPTETTISVALHRPSDLLAEPDPDRYALVPLGRPFAATSIYVLDAGLRPVPDGVAGDLWVAGPALARGYHRAPAATADRFRPDPHGRPGTRMYRTGDRGSRQPDGTLIFLGRADRQVKVRGFRIELGHVESALHRCQGVRDAVVIATDASESGSRLIAYVEVDPDVTEASLRTDAASRLSTAMVPTTFVLLERIPRSSLNGKVSISDLPPPPVASSSPQHGHVSMTTLQRVLSGLFGDVLDRPPPSLDEDFFDAGGDSLQALQLLSQIEQVTGVALTFVEFRDAAHVGGIAEFVREEHLRRAPGPTLTPLCQAGEERPTSLGQQALWFLDRVQRSAPTYSIPICYRISGALDVERLDAALTAVVSRHEALRSSLELREGLIWQRVAPVVTVQTDVHDVAGIDEALRDAAKQVRQPFDLAQGPLLTSTCFRLDDEDHLWLLNVHHAVFDAWSWAVMWRLVADHAAGLPLPTPDLQHGDFAAWQRAWLESPEADVQRSYWRDQLGGDLPILKLGTASAASAVSADGFAFALPVDGLHEPSIERLAADCGTTVFVVLLAGFFVAIRQAVQADDVLVGAPVACRNRPGTDRIIGYLVNTVALRMRFSEGMTFRETIERVDLVVAGALAHQDLPFSEVVADQGRQRRMGEQPLFDAMFGMQSTPLDAPVGFDDLEMTECFVHTGTAKVALTWSLRQTSAGLAGELEFSSDRFDEASARRWERHLLDLIACLVAEPDMSLDDLPNRIDTDERTS